MEQHDEAMVNDGALLRVARQPSSATTTIAPVAEGRRRPRSARRRVRSHADCVFVALTRREADGMAAFLLQGKRAPKLPRTQWALSSVMQREEDLVLLGFSSDGHFLLYYSWWESCYELQWKQVVFDSRTGRFVRERAFFRLPVGTDAAAFGESDNAVSLANGIGSTLKVWQSRDDALVVALATDRHASQENSQIYHISVAPSLACDGSNAASDIISLRFVYNALSPCQEPEPWQLMQISPHQHHNDYYLVINMGTAVMILVFSIVREYHSEKHCSSTVDQAMAASSDARGSLASRRFVQSMASDTLISLYAVVLLNVWYVLLLDAWYSTPEFPVKFQREVFNRKPRFKDESGSYSLAVEYSCQQNFEVEAFLHSFLNKYASLRELNLVDYDLQLVRTSETEKTLFMSCMMELEPSAAMLGSPSHQTHRHIVMALFFSLDITTGEYAVIRAMKLSRQRDLRQLSKMMAAKYKVDIDSRVPSWSQPTSWTNATVTQEQSLLHLHNPRFPVSIYLQ